MTRPIRAVAAATLVLGAISLAGNMSAAPPQSTERGGDATAARSRNR